MPFFKPIAIAKVPRLRYNRFGSSGIRLYKAPALRSRVGGASWGATSWGAVYGTQGILANLDKELLRIKGATLKGLISAQARIRSDMGSVPPTIPRERGNLEKSYFCVTSNEAIIAGRSPSFNYGSTRSARAQANRMVREHRTLVLREAARAKNRKKRFGDNIIFGFSAYYALFVHENTLATNWTRKGSGPKFFETAVKRNYRAVIKMVAEEARMRR